MDPQKMKSMAKTVKWVPTLVGVLAIILGAIGLFLKTEDQTVKISVLLFAALGILGLTLIIMGMSLSGLYDALAELPGNQNHEEDGLD